MTEVGKDLSSELHSSMKQSDTADTMKWFQKTQKMTLIASMVIAGFVGAQSTPSKPTEIEAATEVGITKEIATEVATED